MSRTRDSGSVERVVSGAQTGVDRAALDVALELGIAVGGWVPRGRIDEQGRIPEHYPNLRETSTAEWSERTEANVRDSDGTLILSRGPLTGGSKYTAEVAERIGRPCLHLDLTQIPPEDAPKRARAWLEANDVGVLNVAGPRASKDPGLYRDAASLLRRLLGRARLVASGCQNPRVDGGLVAENKTQPTDASVDEFLDAVENDRRRADARTVLELMRDVTGQEPKMWGPAIVGFGDYHYRYESGRQGDWFLAGFAPRKSNLVVYVMSGFPRHAELMKKLGKHRTGSSCLYINKLDDIDLDVLRELVRRSVEHVAASHETPKQRSE